MEDTKQCADRDTLIYKADLLQVLGQAYGHKLQQVGVSQLATKEKKLQKGQRRT
jgi:hypothetical protein